jgi:TIR domain
MEEQLEIVKLFYCYDRKDKSSLLELEKHLKPLKEKLNFTTWWDEMMSGGTNQKDEIDTQLKESNIVLLFVSSDSLASIECRMIQQQAMELYKAEKNF